MPKAPRSTVHLRAVARDPCLPTRPTVPVSEAPSLSRYNYNNSVNGLTKLFMVLLRIAIGWHLLFEGLTKLDSHLAGVKPFSAEGYLRNSTGPGRNYFRSIIEDFWSFDRLDAEKTGGAWTGRTQQFAADFGFNEEQNKAATTKLADLRKQLADHLADPANAKKIEDYKRQVEKWREDEAAPHPAFERDVLTKTQRDLETHLKGLLTPEQTARSSSTPDYLTWWKRLSELDRSNWLTMWGLTLAGGCRVVGLFSRFSALTAAALLSLFYFSNPPWPGLPAPPNAEGNYLVVNKNLVEMIACLMLATAPTGFWGGLDALVRGVITRPLFGVG
ncbi:MAG: hypothetical protein ACRDD1_10800, partial [Planctomycetia bacterium]